MTNHDSKIRVAIAEDNGLLAQSIRDKLALFPNDIEFRFRADNGRALCDRLKTDPSIDAILMDIEMPEMDGISATAIIKERHPEIRIIMLTVFDDEDKIFRSIQAGADGYLLKEESPDRLRESLQLIMQGGAPMTPVIAARALDLLRHPERIQKIEPEDGPSLSKREIEVLESLSEGLDYKEIAEKLVISPFTVRKHIENIYRILQVNNKMKAVRKAMIRHII